MKNVYGSVDFLSGDAGDVQLKVVSKSDIRNVVERRGLSLFATTLFIAGEMAGSGILALPRAIVDTGYIGIVLLIVFSINAVYGGIKLGDCWNIIEQRYPEYRSKTRNPYSVIAQKSVGRLSSVLVSHCIRFTLFGAGTVYLLLASQIIRSLLRNIVPNVSSCAYFFVIACCMIPPMWLSSPKEFRLVGLGALLSTGIACILYFVQIVKDGQDRTIPAKHHIHGFHDFFLSFGTLLFAFGGASTFPTIQNDMEKKKQFSSGVTIAFIIIMILYVPITLGGFFVYGEDVNTNITLSLSESWLVDMGNIFMVVHLIFAFLIVLNPVCQDVEEAFGIPTDFNWRRCVIRTIILVLMVIVGESIPEFGAILSLVGGSTITLLTFVFPPYFFMKLCDSANPEWEKIFIPVHERIYMWQLIAIGILGGCASTFSAVSAILGSVSFSRPCYWIR